MKKHTLALVHLLTLVIYTLGILLIVAGSVFSSAMFYVLQTRGREPFWPVGETNHLVHLGLVVLAGGLGLFGLGIVMSRMTTPRSE